MLCLTAAHQVWAHSFSHQAAAPAETASPGVLRDLAAVHSPGRGLVSGHCHCRRVQQPFLEALAVLHLSCHVLGLPVRAQCIQACTQCLHARCARSRGWPVNRRHWAAKRCTRGPAAPGRGVVCDCCAWWGSCIVHLIQERATRRMCRDTQQQSWAQLHANQATAVIYHGFSRAHQAWW